MRLLFVVLLVIVDFLATFGVASELNEASVIAPSLRTPSRSISVFKEAAASKRSLATDEAKGSEVDGEGKDNQERVGIPGLSKLAELTVKIRPSSYDLANKLWLRARTDPRNVWKVLRLGEPGVTRLDENPKFVQWLEYVTMYRTERGSHWFSDLDIFDILRKTTPDAELVTLFQSLRVFPGMKKTAEKMQRFLFENSSPTTHRRMNDVWLQSGETPQDVYKILRLGNAQMEDNPMFLQWLRFTEKYRAKMGDGSFSDQQRLNFLLETRPRTLEGDLAVFFVSLKKVPDLKHVGDSLEMHLFQRWMNTFKHEPAYVKGLLTVEDSVPELTKLETRYEVLKAYTLQFAAEKSGKATLEKVERLFASNNPNAALVMAVKAE